jgi:hypothetical protein
LTSDESTLDEVRDLLDDAEPKRPLCVSAAGAFEVHGSSLDGYRMIQHDLSHVIVFNDQPFERRRMAVYLYDRFMKGLQRQPPAVRELPFIDNYRDWLISGYEDVPTSLDYIESQLREHAHDMGPKNAEKLIEAFKTG